MTDQNTKNNFVVDVPDDDADLEDLRALQKVKQEISKKKRALKDKDYLNKHPNLTEIVQDYRRRKVKKGEPKKEGDKIPLEVSETKVDADLEVKPIKKTAEIDYDLLAEKLAEKVKGKSKKSKRSRNRDMFSMDDVPAPTPTEQFNKTLPKTESKLEMPKPKLTVMTNGKFF